MLQRISQIAAGEELRGNQDPLPGWATQALRYFTYAERWRWTPAEVDVLSLPLADDLLLVAEAYDKGRERKQDREIRDAEHRARAAR